MRNKKIDEAMDRLLADMKPGQTYSILDIAKECGCSRRYIEDLYKSAVRKIKNGLV